MPALFFYDETEGSLGKRPYPKPIARPDSCPKAFSCDTTLGIGFSGALV
jgi:hypothetical protein